MKLFLFIGLLLLTGCTQTQNKTPSGTIAEADARQIALEKAGLDNAVFTKQKYDSSDSEFEFEFHTDTQKFECEINAQNGKINDYSVEELNDLDGFFD